MRPINEPKNNRHKQVRGGLINMFIAFIRLSNTYCVLPYLFLAFSSSSFIQVSVYLVHLFEKH